VTKAVVMVGRRRGAPTPPCLPGSAALPFELLPVGNRPVLFHTLDLLDAAGIREVALLVDRRMLGGVQDAVSDADGWSLSLTCLPHDVEGGLGAALAVAEDMLAGDAFLLHLGDSLSRSPFGALTEVGPVSDSDAIMFVDGGPALAPTGIVDLARGRLANIVPGLPTTTPGALAGVAVFGAGAVRAIQDLPDAGDCDLEMLSAAERLAALGGRVDARVLGGWWRFRGQTEALLDANRFVLEGMTEHVVPGALHGSNIQGNVSIHDSAVIKSTTIRGPAIIGPRAKLTDAYIGPYTSIGEDVVVEGAEIEHSIVFPGARISYLGGRLEASVIGTGAKVFRDFRLPRALRLRVGEGAEVSLA
jgi:glucose-1-phosphate thymidylyltransferase